MNFCLPKQVTDSFKSKLRNGELDPKELAFLTSEERRARFAPIVGESNAHAVNALFESKLLLKNQQQGMINWAKKVLGQNTQVYRDTLAKVNRLQEVLQPKQLDAFLEDLAAQRLGAHVSPSEASNLVTMSRDIAMAKSKMRPDFTFPTYEDRMAYGRALVKFNNYVEDLKVSSDKLTMAKLKNDPLGTVGDATSRFAGLTKSLKATLDVSMLLRQGLKLLFNNPGEWAKLSIKTIDDVVKTFGGKEVLDGVKAEILSRPNALNGLYKREKLAVGVVEEAFPTSLPAKVPIVGRVFKASEVSFTAFQYRLRADMFDKYVQTAQKTGGDIKGLGLVANTLSGRGRLGFLEPAATATNNIFFSPRFVKSNIDALTGQLLDYRQLGGTARKQAAINTLRTIGGIAMVLKIADSVMPGSVEWDSRSSDFGKIKVGDTRFDVSGGMASLVTLASRVVRGSSKSSTTGKVTQLNTGKYGSTTILDVLINFGLGKLSPVASVLRDLSEGHTFEGEKPGIVNESENLFLPIGVQNYQELKNNPNSANIIVAMIADALGIGTNTYGKK